MNVKVEEKSNVKKLCNVTPGNGFIEDLHGLLLKSKEIEYGLVSSIICYDPYSGDLVYICPDREVTEVETELICYK